MLMDNLLVRALSRLFDLILLNILWVVCSLPVITIGASTTALYAVMLKIVANEEGYIIKDFFRAFRRNFKQSTIVWLALAVIGAALGMDVMIFWGKSGVVSKAILLVLFAAIGVYAIEILFVFPLIATFENTTKNMLKNAVLIPISRLPFTILVLVMTGMCLILTFLNRTTIMTGAVIWSIVGVSLLAFANSFFVRKVFEPYM